MITELRPYPAYKPSGIEWLGEVPAHWDVRRLQTAASILNGATPSTGKEEYLYGDILWITPEDLGALQGRRITDSARKITVEGHASCGTSLAAQNSIVISTRAPIGHLGILSSTACTNQGCKLLVPQADIAPEYLFDVLESARSELQSRGQGTTFAELSRAKLGSFRLSIPPLPEQIAIARFLNHATDRIERYLRTKEKLIALLEEQKQVLVHDAVTGRIDVRTGKPYPKYKSSGVKWLGDVPAHWNIRKLRQCAKAVGGMTPSMEDRRFWNGSIPWVTPKDMKRDVVTDSSVKVSDAALSDTGLRLIDPPAVLMVVRGMILARKVPVARTTSPVTVNQDMKALVPVRGIDSAFLANVLASAQDALGSMVDVAGHGTRRLPTERWRALEIPVCPVVEQSNLVSFINTARTRIDDVIKCARCEIHLLREYRTRLIADVVTGKLDVREVAEKLQEPKSAATEDGRETVHAALNPRLSDKTSGKEANP